MFKVLPITLSALALFGIALASMDQPAAAQGTCRSWSAAKVEREEGPRWTASVCAKQKGRDAILEIVCFGSQWNIRYLPVLPQNQDFGDTIGDFVFRTSTGSRRVALGFEGMDGAFATDLDNRHPLFEMLMSGDKLAISDTSRKVATQTYPLNGSRAALTKLKKRCKG